jgi:hypothetical protein
MASLFDYCVPNHESRGVPQTLGSLCEKEEKKKLTIIYNIVKRFTGRKAYDLPTICVLSLGEWAG